MSQLHLVLPAPRLPKRARSARTSVIVTAVLHLTVAGLLAVLTLDRPIDARRETTDVPPQPVQVPRMVFLQVPGPGGGGGGGGIRQLSPPSRAQSVGTDRISVPTARQVRAERNPDESMAPQQLVVLDAFPLTSGVTYQMGMPEAPSSLPFSLGPGVGGGVGEGVGTGLGAGRGSGLGPGSGGGIGGGIYKAGNGVSAPTLISQVRPNYTPEAMQRRIQGTVVLEMIVAADGVPYDVRVVRSLDALGLDEEAIRAARQWRFNPGRLGQTPVDVLVRLVIDFHLR